MYYYKLKYLKKEFRERTVKDLLRLRKNLDSQLPTKDADDNVLIGSWNIRDLDKNSKRGFGKRNIASLFYIAEIISRFDVIALQEVNNIGKLEEIMALLGDNWDYIATDIVPGELGGNGERMTFVFDKRKVWFKNIAGEIVLPSNLLISKVQLETRGKKVTAGKQFRRTPFIVSFQSNWLRFDLCTVHIYYGSSSGDKLQERIDEINAIAKYLSKKSDYYLNHENKHLIILGDFNIVSREHETMDQLKKNDFFMPEEIGYSNMLQNKAYDQIAFKKQGRNIDYNGAGVLEIFNWVYRSADWKSFMNDMKASANFNKKVDDENNENQVKKYYKEWKTYHLSDHLPLWVQLTGDNANSYLNKIKD